MPFDKRYCVILLPEAPVQVTYSYQTRRSGGIVLPASRPSKPRTKSSTRVRGEPRETSRKEPRANRSTIWVLSDGTAGMRLQAIALGDALVAADAHNQTNLVDVILTLPWWARRFPRLAAILPLSWLRAGLRAGIKAGRHPASGQPDLSAGMPDIAITCGRRMAGISIAIRRLGKAGGADTRTIHIQDPRLPPDYFDVLVVPQHDPARGPNIVTSLASLNRLDPAKIKQAAARLTSKWTSLPTPLVAVMLGGTNRRYRISADMADEMAARLANFAAKTGASLAMITSRRTPVDLLDRLTSSLDKTRYAVLDQHDDNPYPGILGIADAVIVTSDSVNMISEATVTGLPVLIADWQRESGRIGAFHDAMMAAGHCAPLADTLPKKGFLPLNEMPEIAKAVLMRLGR